MREDVFAFPALERLIYGKPAVHTPLSLWLSTGVRAIDRLTEGLCWPRSNPVSDGMYQHALKPLGSSLLRTKRDPADLDARLTSFYGIWLAIAGRHGGVEMGASHAIGHVLGGSCGVPHGYTSCVILPHVRALPDDSDQRHARPVAPQESGQDHLTRAGTENPGSGGLNGKTLQACCRRSITVVMCLACRLLNPSLPPKARYPCRPKFARNSGSARDPFSNGTRRMMRSWSGKQEGTLRRTCTGRSFPRASRAERVLQT